MKHRILFVDDDPLVLQGLRRMLYPLRNEWEMEFAESGDKALNLLAASQFKVVVSDMRMPGMNGAELLNRVMQAYPKTIRLILSGHADSDLIMKCVGATHQYLAKPCDAETLKTTINRAAALENTLQNDALRQLAAHMDHLPSCPALYTEITAKLQSPDVGLDEIADIIARDIGMTAKILKLVNSAFFGMSREISAPKEAVAHLGLDTIKALVLSTQAFALLKSPDIEGFSADALWDHSLRTATAARAIARAEHAAPNIVEETFTAGLLHDTGKLVFAANCGKQFATALEMAATESLPVTEAERRIFGASHAELGGYLLSLWGLPVPLVEAVTLHHTPAASVAQGFGSLIAVHTANALVQEASPTPDAQLDLPHLTTLGFAERVPVWRAAVQAAFEPKE